MDDFLKTLWLDNFSIDKQINKNESKKKKETSSERNSRKKELNDNQKRAEANKEKRRINREENERMFKLAEERREKWKKAVEWMKPSGFSCIGVNNEWIYYSIVSSDKEKVVWLLQKNKCEVFNIRPVSNLPLAFFTSIKKLKKYKIKWKRFAYNLPEELFKKLMTYTK